MAHPYHHALSSVKKWGGTVEDTLAVHAWFDASKSITADFRHRALRHHAEGIFMAETIFGPTITLSTGRVILTLAGDGAIALDVEALEVTLRDVTRPYIAPSGKAPQHPAD
ncbi:hypothetical protein LCGC14_1335040 [marine sediment metagenome]|uniref:DUF6915 domain-containing protein n=1 Tax=marine sediment metagenome TaxID=412755 RepID=A0A0F9KFC7_9ZZZZ